MDIRRPPARGQRWRQVLIWGAPALLVLVLLVWSITLLQRPPAVAAERVWSGSVERGELVREVAAAGSLVAPRLRAVTNRNAGVIEEVLVLPGDRVEHGDVLIVMSSPDLDEELATARWDLAAAEADEAVQQVESENRQLDLVAQLAQAESEYTGARLELEAQEELAGAQVFSAIELERSRLRVSQLRRRLEAEQARSERAPELRQAQRDAAQARLARHRDKVAHLEALVELLSVRAPNAGIVQDVLVQEGERLNAGQQVASIVDPEHLIARLRVPEREAADVLIGQPVRLEVGRETIAGEVTRVDPSARDRHIDVDVALVSNPRPGLRPDQSISGRIELDRVEDVLHLPRPAQARQEGQRLRVFVLDDSGRRAQQREIEIGRLSASRAEVTSGLNTGEQVILADLSEYEDSDRIRLR